MSRRIHLDANVVLRFLRNDDPRQSPTSAELFKRSQAGEFQLVLSPAIVLEVFYVLSKGYGMARPDAANAIRLLFDTGAVLADQNEIVIDALKRITANKISFADAYLAAVSVELNEEVVSFDEGMASFSDAHLFPLNSLSQPPK